MGCCESTPERQALVVAVEDGSTRTVDVADLPLFDANDTSTDFFRNAMHKSGPLVSFGVQRSPEGIKPFMQPEISKLLKPLRKFELFHGGEQLLFVAWCTVDAPGTAEQGGKPRIVALTSLGRLYCVHPGAKVTASCSATQISRAMLQGFALVLFFSDQRPSWRVSSTPAAAAQLQRMLWVISSLAHSQLIMQTNMSALPLHLLPPLAIDGNLHSAYTIFANAHEFAEPEDVLRSGDVQTTPALQCIRQWMLRMEVDVSEWRPECLAPLALALRHNDRFMAFKAEGVPLGAKVGPALALMLAANKRLVSLSLERVGGTPADFVAIGQGLAANPESGLSVIKLSGNQVGDEGAGALAAGLARLRPGVLAELHLQGCGIGPQGMQALLGALLPQRNLLQLHVAGNLLSGVSALAQLIGQTKQLEELSLGGSGADAATLASLAPASLRALRTLDLSGVAWGDALLGVLRAAGDNLARLNLSGGAPTISSAGKQPFLRELLEWSASRPKLELDLSVAQAPSALLPDLLAVLPHAALPAGLKLADSQLDDAGLAELLQALLPQAAPLRSLDVSNNLTYLPDALDCWSMPEAQALQLLDELANAMTAANAAGSDSALWEFAARWRVQVQPGMEGAVAGRLLCARGLTQLLRGAPDLKKLALRGSWTAATAKALSPPPQAFGVMVSAVFKLGLATSTSLTSLDVTGNGFGDAGATALGAALRTNRTLTSLQMDHNGTGADGLKAVKMALNGNKKLVDLPLPDADIDAALAGCAQQYKWSLQNELAARHTVKGAYGRGGICDHSQKNRGLGMLTIAKKQQAAARVAKDKLRKIAAELQANVQRNQEVAQIKSAGKSSKAAAKEAAQAQAAAAKAKGKAEAKREGQKLRVWQRRHKLLDQCKRHAKAVRKEQGKDTAWFDAWLKAWGKPYLAPKGLAQLKAACPGDQAEPFASLFESCEDAFAEEEGLDAQVEALLAEARQQHAQAEFASREVQYYGMLASLDPSRVQKPPVVTGILLSKPPGKEAPGQFMPMPYTDWNARYRWICGELGSAISAPPPADYTWTPKEAKEPLGKRPPPMIAYPQPEVVQGTVVSEPQPAPASAFPMSAQAQPPPESEQLTMQKTSSVEPVPYPAVVIAESVYAKNADAYAPPKAPPPSPAFTPPPQPPPVAQPAPQAAQMLMVSVPPGVMPGQSLQVQSPFGGVFMVQVPPGLAPGGQMQVQVPAPAQQPVQPPPQPQQPPAPPAQVFTLPPQKQYIYRHHPRNRRDDDYLMYGYGGLGAYYLYSSYSYQYDLMYYRRHDYQHYGYHHCSYHGHGADWGHGDYHHGYHHGYHDHDPYTDAVGDAYGEDTPLEPEPEPEAEAEVEAEAEGADEGAGVDEGGEAEGMDMYAGAGPRDLPDGGPDGGRVAQMARRCREAAEARRRLAASRVQVARQIEARWLELTQRAENEIFGAPCAPAYVTKPGWLAPPPCVSPRGAITLVTQCSLDRLPSVRAQLAAWRGPASVALYLDAEPGSAAALAEEARLRGELRDAPELCSALTLSLLYRTPPPTPPPAPGSAAADALLYPVNALRNLALRQARTELVFLLDADFVPSANLRRELHADPRLLEQLASSRTALVVPAFEVDAGQPLPRQQASLAALAHASPPLASGFHVGHFPAGHAPTDFGRWFGAAAPYEVGFEEYYEPYVVVSRKWLPEYDERFRGYGMNKVAHLYAAAARGARFVVFPRGFVAAHEHRKSGAWEATFGSQAHPLQRMRIAALYKRLKNEQPPLPLPPASPPLPRASASAPPASASTVAAPAAARQARKRASELEPLHDAKRAQGPKAVRVCA